MQKSRMASCRNGTRLLSITGTGAPTWAGVRPAKASFTCVLLTDARCAAIAYALQTRGISGRSAGWLRSPHLLRCARQPCILEKGGTPTSYRVCTTWYWCCACWHHIHNCLLQVVQAYGAALAEAEAGKRRLVALDCGAGVGRVTEQLLLHHCQEVDLVEPSGEQHAMRAW